MAYSAGVMESIFRGIDAKSKNPDTFENILENGIKEPEYMTWPFNKLWK